MGRIAIVVVAVVALAVGFGAGWAVFGTGSDDADLACASAENLPEELPERPDDDGAREEQMRVLNRISGTAWLAQAAGQDGPDFRDLDDLGEAGQRLHAVTQELKLDEYADARAALLEECGG